MTVASAIKIPTTLVISIIITIAIIIMSKTALQESAASSCYKNRQCP